MVGRTLGPSYHHEQDSSVWFRPSRAVLPTMVGRTQGPSYHHVTYVSARRRLSRNVRRLRNNGVGALVTEGTHPKDMYRGSERSFRATILKLRELVAPLDSGATSSHRISIAARIESSGPRYIILCSNAWMGASTHPRIEYQYEFTTW